MSFFKLSSISKSFSHKTILRDISLQAEKGEVLRIIGENGAGKSTLFRVASGLLKPDSGEVVFNEYNLAKLQDFELAKKKYGISYLGSQNQLYLHLSIRQNIELSSCLNNIDFQLAQNLVERFELGSYLEHYPTECSSGVLKKIAIVRACAHAPKLLILDEPFVHLDLSSCAVIVELIKELTKLGTLVLLISHAEIDLNQEKFLLKDGSLQKI